MISIDIWPYGYGHRIKNGIFDLEVDIEFKMGYLDPGLLWTRANLDPGLSGPGPISGPGTGEAVEAARLSEEAAQAEAAAF